MAVELAGSSRVQTAAAVAGGLWAYITDINQLVAVLSLLVLLYSMAEKLGWIHDAISRVTKTVIAVGVFLFILVASMWSEQAQAESRPYVDLGKTVFNSSLTTGGVGVRVNDKWDFQVRSIGEGNTKNGHQDQAFNFGVSRVVSPSWAVFGGEIKTGIGVVYSPGLQLVGPWNYRLRVILNYDICEFEFFHDSSADTFDPNTGVDSFLFRLFL